MSGYSTRIIIEIYESFVKGKGKLLKLSYSAGDYVLIQDGDKLEVYGDYLKVDGTDYLLGDKNVTQFIDGSQIRNVVVSDDIKSDLKDFINSNVNIFK